MIIFDKNNCINICVKNTNKYVLKAVSDLISDFNRASKYNTVPKVISEETDFCIVIEENLPDSCDPLKNEGFVIKSDNGKIRISADTYLGTMWGIYTFSEKILGIDPCYLFNDLEPQTHSLIETDELNIIEEPNGFGFRGIFINDEDFLTGWKDGGGIRYLDSGWYSVVVEKSVMEMVVETALRLKLNLVIPASFLDIDNPAEKLLADCVAERGIFLSQHHIEPLGVSFSSFANYCKKYDKLGEFSYLEYPKLMEEVWNYYAKKWAKYDHIVWQIGLRGAGDRPVWEEKTPDEDQLKEYGQFISDAYKKQKEIVLNATDGKAKYFTSTLWMEGSLLAEKKLLQFPEDVITVFADCGPNQMYGTEFYSVPRQPGNKYGIYYHLQFFCCGPHLAPQTGLDKLKYNIDLAKDKGDTSYCILNVSNIREFVYELTAYSQMMWNINEFSIENYTDKYCQIYLSQSEKAKKLISDYYDKLPELDSGYLSKHHESFFNYSLTIPPSKIKNFVLKEGNVLEHGNIILSNFHNSLGDRLCKEFYEVLKLSVNDYAQIAEGFKSLAEAADESVKKHTEVKWLLYSNTLLLIYKWYVNLYEAKMYYDSYQGEKVIESLKSACKNLEEYLKLRKCAEYGVFENWYRGDLKMHIKQRLYDTNKLLGQTPDFN